MAKAKAAGPTIKTSFGKKRAGQAKNYNTPKGSKVKKYRGQGR